MRVPEREPGGSAQPAHVGYGAGLWAPLPRWMDRTLRVMSRYAWVLFFVLIPAYAIALFVPAIGSWPLAFGVTLAIALKALLYTIFAVGMLPFFGSFYWHACRTPPRAWWQYVLPLSMLLLAAGLGTLAATLLLNPQYDHSTDLPPIMVVAALVAVIGLVAFGAGNIGLVRAISRQRRLARQTP